MPPLDVIILYIILYSVFELSLSSWKVTSIAYQSELYKELLWLALAPLFFFCFSGFSRIFLLSLLISPSV
jgi:hypothetical protein